MTPRSDILRPCTVFQFLSTMEVTESLWKARVAVQNSYRKEERVYEVRHCAMPLHCNSGIPPRSRLPHVGRLLGGITPFPILAVHYGAPASWPVGRLLVGTSACHCEHLSAA